MGRHGGRPYKPLRLKECFLQNIFFKIHQKTKFENIETPYYK